MQLIGRTSSRLKSYPRGKLNSYRVCHIFTASVADGRFISIEGNDSCDYCGRERTTVLLFAFLQMRVCHRGLRWTKNPGPARHLQKMFGPDRQKS